jgi:hypothetical protein
MPSTRMRIESPARVDGTHDRRAAGEIAQIVEALLLGRAARRCFVRHDFAASGVERAGDVLERGDDDFGLRVEGDLGGAQRFRIARIGHRDANAALGAGERKDRRLAQEPLAESAPERLRRGQFRERGAAQVEALGDLVGKILRREIAGLEQSAQRQPRRARVLRELGPLRPHQATRRQRLEHAQRTIRGRSDAFAWLI